VARIVHVTRQQRWRFTFVLAQGGEFAFVVFNSARQVSLISREWDALLTVVVAMSMAATPLLLLAHDRWIARGAETQREPDFIDTQAPVIIAGFGRFGQIVGRLLLASGVRAVVLDHDPDQVDLVRRAGYPVFYGDATRLDLLEAAGAAKARLLVNAIDGQEDSLALVDRVREHFPNLPIVSRARNVSHYPRAAVARRRRDRARDLRVGACARAHVLEQLGMDPFRTRDRGQLPPPQPKIVDSQLAVYKDETRFMAAAKAAREELEEQFARDRERFEKERGGAGMEMRREARGA
jgi:glutathione-regulated potassium-efflux system ancillary protein KefC